MTIQQKTAAILAILANQQENVAATQAAQVTPGLTPYVIDAMNSAMKTDLEAVFAFKPAKNSTMTARKKR
jgi:N-acetylmuramic acid 6-phosphate (MurNAc-6-P) etherase